ncbi:transcriptional regulator [Bifidobacterium goeldii]|uniref:Transcriptional regulator n=1 Tax=Bifidobacterium goeldii TaxID=2306975 RepID=A0A430FNI2_9BIFI|nr:LacI family DNA-binding transcriptional regulator [Bifidobacterium goeldii]RSX54392.1 transcriptional regulator [Bifidobacterium goeldii]
MVLRGDKSGKDEKTITIRDVAKRAGVAVSTASRALGGGSASEATREKVRRAAEELQFVPNLSARRLTGGRSNVVALVAEEPTDFLFRDDFIVGILGQLSASLTRRNLLPFLSLVAPGDVAGFEELMGKSGAEGVVAVSFHEGEQFAGSLRAMDKPIVFIGAPPKGYKAPFVDVDNYDGGYQAGRHLVERGCRNIALIEGPKDMPTPRERTGGFLAALKENNLEPVMVCSGSYEIENGQRSMERILSACPQVDGVFAHSDKIAAGVLQVLDKAGKHIPNDVAVIGFDDLQAARLLNPPLTTVAQPLNVVAEAATDMLVYRLEHGSWKVSSQRFPVRLIVRESA